MAQSRYFYADSSKKPKGPFSLDQLHELAREGVIKPSTKVIRKGDSQWMSYAQLPTKETPKPAPVVAASEDVPPADPGFSLWNFLRRLPKPIYFALLGALGAFIGALAGQLLLLLIGGLLPKANDNTTVEKNICLVLDTSGSMMGGPLSEVKSAADSFVQKQENTDNRLCVVSFNDDARLVHPLTTNSVTLKAAINNLSSSGSTALDLGLKQALRALPILEGESTKGGLIADTRNGQPMNFVLIFTDGVPNNEALAESAAEELRDKGAIIMVIHTPAAPAGFLNNLTKHPQLVFTTSAGNYGDAFDKAEQVIEKRQGIVDSTQKGNWLASFLGAGGWFALVAVFLALALGVAQNKAMGRAGLSGYLTSKQLLFGCLIGICAGLIAGLINLVFVMVSDVAVISFIGGVLAWCILGGIIGTSMVLVIENFGFLRAVASGLIGGMLGGLAFNVIRLITGALGEEGSLINSVGEGIGRLLGAVLVGALVGMFIAWIEQLTRKAWMEVHWTANQSSTVNLGSNPITVGGSREDDVRIPGLNKALSIILDGGHIKCTQKPENKTFELSNGQTIKLGTVRLTVRSKEISKD